MKKSVSFVFKAFLPGGMHSMRILYQENDIEFLEPTAVALGFFDGVHKGHTAVIHAAKAAGLRTVVVTFTQHPSEVLKDRSVKTIMSNQSKEKVLEQLHVDVLYYLDFKSVMELSAEAFLRDSIIKKLNAAYIFCGFNYRFGRGGEAGPEELQKICQKYGAVGVSAQPVCEGGAPVSSTRIRALIEQGEIKAAAELLGRPFEICMEVVHGRRLGRQFGTPTINQRIPQSLVTPRYGVYASVTHVGGEALPSVTNVGVKPTVGGRHISAETYIMGFSGDLYGKTVAIDLIAFMRPEIKFESLEALKTQIKSDADSSSAIICEYLSAGSQGSGIHSI
jgi:riboflavin kinase/FMN adenylyltransferase